MNFHPPLPKDSEVEEAFAKYEAVLTLLPASATSIVKNTTDCKEIKVKKVDKSKITFPSLSKLPVSNNVYEKKYAETTIQPKTNTFVISMEDQNRNIKIIQEMTDEERREEIENLKKSLPSAIFERWSAGGS